MKASSKLKKTKSAKPAARSLEAFEAKLLRVIERPGLSFSSPSHTKKISKEHKIPKPSGSRAELFTAPPSEDRVKSLDHALIKRNVQFQHAKTPQLVRIRFEPHAESPHRLTLQDFAGQRIKPSRDSQATIPEWRAPFEPPPSLDELVHLAQALYLRDIDPRIAIEQFTPSDYERASWKRFHVWRRIAAPFIRWEWTPSVFQGSATHACADQFTPPDFTFAYQAVYGWPDRWFFWRSLRDLSADRQDLPVGRQDEDVVKNRVTSTRMMIGDPALVPRWRTWKMMLGFLALCFVVSVPALAISVSRSLQGNFSDVRTSGNRALLDVRAALAASGDERTAAWKTASSRLAETDRALHQVSGLAQAAAALLPGTRDFYRGAQDLLYAGEQSSRAAALLSDGLEHALKDPTLHPDERLQTFSTYANSASPLLEDAAASVGRVNPDRLPPEARLQFQAIKEGLSAAQQALREARAVSDLLLAALGHDRDRTYLFLFQNQTELRPTGGFIGSVAEITFDRGEMKHVFVPGGGPYDVKGQLLARVVPPKPLQLVADRWEFQDANWSPDFPTAAKKIAWFWSKAGGPTVDGVIAINESLMERLLRVTGPIAMPAYGKTITADNFLSETQKTVELEYDKMENKPKKFIADLMPNIIKKMRDGSNEDWMAYAKIVADALETKEIQTYLARADEEEKIERWGWNSRMKPSSGDALALTEANIAGQKTDGVIEERVHHRADIAEDGAITDTVTFTRTHHGKKGELFRGVNNVEYLRVYVPRGSKLVEASGFHPPSPSLFKKPLPQDPSDPEVFAVESKAVSRGDVDVTEEFSRTVYGGWLQLAPGETAVTTFKYRLPFSAFDLARDGKTAYALLATSQPGKSDRALVSEVRVPDSWRVAWTSEPSRVRAASAKQSPPAFSGAWDRDLAFAGLFEPPHVEAEP